MTTLHDRLEDLAQEAPPGAAAGPDLWTRGRTYGRRRAAVTAGAVLAVALIAALGAAGLSGRPLRPVEPVAPTGKTVLPSRFFVPSGRLPVAHDGIGPLVAVIPAQHFSWTSTSGEQGLVGVSAVDQQYAFLDLPGWVSDGVGSNTWSLSPDGRWLAYWYGDGEATSSYHPANGIAVLDTASGAVRRHELTTDLGVAPEKVGWSGDTLWFTQWNYTEVDEDGSAERVVASWAWVLTQAEPHEVDDPDLVLTDPIGPALEDALLVRRDDDRLLAIADEGDLTGEPVARVQVSEHTALSSDGRTIATSQPNEEHDTGKLLAGPVAGDDTQLAPLTFDAQYPVLLGFLDPDTLTALAFRHDERQVVTVDSRTGETHTLSTFEQVYDDGTQLASDLLRSPVVHAKVPPHPVDPRLVALWVGGGLLGLLFLVYLVVVVRRARA
jgi:hypothetical protein